MYPGKGAAGMVGSREWLGGGGGGILGGRAPCMSPPIICCWNRCGGKPMEAGDIMAPLELGLEPLTLGPLVAAAAASCCWWDEFL